MSSIAMEVNAHLAAFLSLMLFVSAVHKYLERERLVTATARLARVHLRYAPALLSVAALIELGAAVTLWSPATRVSGSVIAVLVWCAYLAFIVRAILSGDREFDCGCSFGQFGNSKRGLGEFEVIRNVALAFLAAVVALTGHLIGANPLGSLTLMSGVLLLVLYASIDQLVANIHVEWAQ
jgi:hypothetical protein